MHLSTHIANTLFLFRFFDFGALLGDRTSDSGVSSSLLRYNPFSQRSNYLEFDYNFQQSCCENSDMCQEYTRLRPSDYCSSYRPQRRGTYVCRDGVISAAFIQVKSFIRGGPTRVPRLGAEIELISHMQQQWLESLKA